MRTWLGLIVIFLLSGQSQAGLRVDTTSVRPECKVHSDAIARGTAQPRRIALTIGNNKTLGIELKNAVNDARLMASTLRELGWSVSEASDLGKPQFLAVVKQFSDDAARLCDDDIALFYFAGNGFEVNQLSYIATADLDVRAVQAGAKISADDEAKLLEQMLSLTALVKMLEGHGGAKVIILDACRDDPLTQARGARSEDARPVRLPSNMLVAYSSESGEQSMDDGPNPQFGPYAWVLAKALRDSGSPAEEIFRRVRREVVEYTKARSAGYTQSPFVASTLTSDVYLGTQPSKRAGTPLASLPAGEPKPQAGSPVRPADPREKRIALVIANAKYGDLPELTNPANDTREIAASLQRTGFTVTAKSNLTLSQMNKVLRDFGDEAEGADWALVYFAGHGMELGGRTFLLPTDVEVKQDKHATEEAVLLDRLIEKVEGARSLGLVLLDACRNNPFLKTMKRTGRLPEVALGRSRGDASTSAGLGHVQIDKAGVLVVYSARHGTEAFDGQPDRLSPFAEALVAELERPGTDVQMMFRKVRDRVMEITEQRQEPFSYGSLPGREFFFRAPRTEVETYRR